MRFTVTHTNPGPNGPFFDTDQFDGRYDFKEGGVLVVTQDEGDTVSFSPAHWVKVESPKQRSSYEIPM